MFFAPIPAIRRARHSNVTRDHLLHALSVTDIACVQNPMNLADRAAMPVLEEWNARTEQQ
jgi:aryl-alcohol dehydrogenase-like predicted oxidoreductase